jgi:hypothetical protein
VADPSESFGPNEAADIPTEDQYARWARSLGIVDGVIPSTQSFDPPDLRVTANGTGVVTVAAGEANVGGVWYRNSAPLIRDIPINTLPMPRLDSVVLRMDNVANEVTIGYTLGIGAAMRPLVRNFGVLWETRLATVFISTGAATASAGSVSDHRQFIVPGQFAMNSGTDSPVAAPGQLQARPGRLYMANAAGEFEHQVYPEPDPTFVRFTYGSFWRDYNAGSHSDTYANGAYAVFANNIVQLRGMVEPISGSGAAVGSIIARLPEGLRPTSRRAFIVHGNSGSGGGAIRVDIEGSSVPADAGKIFCTSNIGGSGYVSLDGINFWANA